MFSFFGRMRFFSCFHSSFRALRRTPPFAYVPRERWWRRSDWIYLLLLSPPPAPTRFFASMSTSNSPHVPLKLQNSTRKNTTPYGGGGKKEIGPVGPPRAPRAAGSFLGHFFFLFFICLDFLGPQGPPRPPGGYFLPTLVAPTALCLAGTFFSTKNRICLHFGIKQLSNKSRD